MSESFSSKTSQIKEAAREYLQAGLQILPCVDKIPAPRIKNQLGKIAKTPLHSGNYEYYFEQATQIALKTGNKLECIDVDCKYDLTGNLWDTLIKLIKYALPIEVYQKLVVEKTPSGGYHLFYKCHQIGANQVFAARIATPKEQERGERVKVLIESRGEGGHAVCYPSPGYELEMGSIEEIGFISIENRSLLINICKAFDRSIPVQIPGLAPEKRSNKAAPWYVFNEKHGWEWILEKLQESDWEITGDTASIVRVKRPGTLAKSSGCVFKDTNIFFVFSTSTEFEAGKPITAFGVLTQISYDGDMIACAQALADQGIGEFNERKSEFYDISPSGKVIINNVEILKWMKDVGYRKFWLSKSEFMIVQIVNSIAKPVPIDRIKKTFGSHIENIVSEKVFNLFLVNIKKIFTIDGLMSMLDDLSESKFIKSIANQAWLFFANGALRITPTSADLVSYEKLQEYGLVWSKSIIQRDFQFGSLEGDISKLINLLCGNRPMIKAMFMTAIGYLLHKYKDPSNPFTIILNDELMDEDTTSPQGGTGKGLLIKLISKYREVHIIDGKRINFDSPFVYQGISHDTEIVAIEDVSKGFNFEKLFSVITEDIKVEEKGHPPYAIPYHRSPKFLITSNYAIKGSSSSHLRRRYEVELAPFFSHKLRPFDFFGH